MVRAVANVIPESEKAAWVTPITSGHTSREVRMWLMAVDDALGCCFADGFADAGVAKEAATVAVESGAALAEVFLGVAATVGVCA